MRWAIHTGMSESRMASTATTLTIGSCRGRERLARIQIGSVSCWPAVNVVTITSSKDSAKASRPPATIADRSDGSVTCRNVCHVLAPRSADASSYEVDSRRNRAIVLL